MSPHQMNQQLAGHRLINEEQYSRFTLFPLLPIEIRLRIWRFHNYRSRIIMCKYYWNNRAREKSSLLPASFAVHSESREEAKKAFSLIFEQLLSYDIAFNNVADTLYFAHQEWIRFDVFLPWYSQKAGFVAGALVKSLAMYLDLISHMDPAGVIQIYNSALMQDTYDICMTLKCFPNVQELFFITRSKSQQVLNVIRPLVTKIYAQLRRDRAECCEKHDPECDCTIWRFPKIYWHTLDELEEKLGAEVVKY